MKITKIIRNVAKEHTWDISTSTEQYSLSNGCISHNTSAQISNATNGIEPPRSLVSIKGSKQSAARQVVPDIEKLTNKYECLYDMPNMDGYIKLVGVMQKFVDQSISGNTSYDPTCYNVNDPETGQSKLPLKVLVEDFLKCYKYGWKTGYYNNIDDGRDIETREKTQEAPTLSKLPVIEDDDCDSCKI